MLSRLSARTVPVLKDSVAENKKPRTTKTEQEKEKKRSRASCSAHACAQVRSAYLGEPRDKDGARRGDRAAATGYYSS